MKKIATLCTLSVIALSCLADGFIATQSNISLNQDEEIDRHIIIPAFIV